MPTHYNAVSFINTAPLLNINAHPQYTPMQPQLPQISIPQPVRSNPVSSRGLRPVLASDNPDNEQDSGEEGLNKRFRLLPSISPADSPSAISDISNNNYDARRVQMKPYPGHIWLAEHPAHLQENTANAERSILLHAGGTLEQPDQVHENLWPQLSRLGNLDLAVVDFGSIGLLRSNDFHENRVYAALKYLIEIGYKPERIALSGGSKGAYAAARANAKLSATHRLGALVLCSPVLSARSALSILLHRMSQRPDCPKLMRLFLGILVNIISPEFLNMRKVKFDADTPTFIIKGGQDWAHNEATDMLLNQHIRSQFSDNRARNLNWITYEDAGHQLQIEDRHAQWVLAFLTGSKVGQIVGALEHQRFTSFPQVFRSRSAPIISSLSPSEEQTPDEDTPAKKSKDI